jgi:hypothetical protein
MTNVGRARWVREQYAGRAGATARASTVSGRANPTTRTQSAAGDLTNIEASRATLRCPRRQPFIVHRLRVSMWTTHH